MIDIKDYKILTGNYSVSEAVKLARVKFISAYPITPQTTIVERLSELVASGEIDGEFMKVESEHSAMSACIGAEASGVRSFTATSSHGLALMHEMLHWAAGARLPIVMAEVNRAMGPPWSIWSEQTDSLAQRDTGWMQVYCENNQEAMDMVLMGYKVAEQVRLPFMLILDAFILSHTSEPVKYRKQELVDEFLPPYEPKYSLVQDGKKPYAFGSLVSPEWYYEFKYKAYNDMVKAIDIFKREGKLFERLFNQNYDVLENFYLDDADIVFVGAGAMVSTAKEAIMQLRQEGKKAGLLKIRMFRPFPYEDVRKTLKDKKKVIVLDRNLSLGAGGIFYQEFKSALYKLQERPKMYGYVLGLGGRDILVKDYIDIYNEVKEDRVQPLDVIWRGVKI